MEKRATKVSFSRVLFNTFTPIMSQGVSESALDYLLLALCGSKDNQIASSAQLDAIGFRVGFALAERCAFISQTNSCILNFF
jgi:hypothetical protein